MNDNVGKDSPIVTRPQTGGSATAAETGKAARAQQLASAVRRTVTMRMLRGGERTAGLKTKRESGKKTKGEARKRKMEAQRGDKRKMKLNE